MTTDFESYCYESTVRTSFNCLFFRNMDGIIQLESDQWWHLFPCECKYEHQNKLRNRQYTWKINLYSYNPNENGDP